jgi:hypothetical protein
MKIGKLTSKNNYLNLSNQTDLKRKPKKDLDLKAVIIDYLTRMNNLLLMS